METRRLNLTGGRTLPLACAAVALAGAAACGNSSDVDYGPVAEGITSTIRSFSDNQDFEGSQSLVCQEQRIVSTGLADKVRAAEKETGNPLYRPFPPDDRDYADFLAAYREVSVPPSAVSVDQSGQSANVEIARLENNRVLPDTGRPLQFRKSQDGRWLFCDDVVFGRGSVTESINEFLRQSELGK